MRISEFIQRSGAARCARDLFALTEHAAGELGFDRIAYGALAGRELYGQSDTPPPAVLLNYPWDWQERYFKRGYQNVDPVVLYSASIAVPYAWDDVPKFLSIDGQQRLLFNEAAEAGLNNGLTVPLLGPAGSLAVVSFASSQPIKEAPVHLERLHVIAAQFHVAYLDLLQVGQRAGPRPILSGRERECLKWIARGKSSWDIGRILSISEYTVNYHVRKALRKLETSSRTVAVVKAIRLGLIRL